MKSYMSVGKLKKLMENLPDDTPILHDTEYKPADMFTNGEFYMSFDDQGNIEQMLPADMVEEEGIEVGDALKTTPLIITYIKE